MKKVLLSFALAAFVFAAKAQTCSNVGFSTDANGNYIGFYQDFSDTGDFYVAANQAGIFPWGDVDATDTNHFYAPFTKTGGYLTYTVRQEEGRFEPVGISFGKDTNTNKINTIDLSGNADFEVGIKNLSAEDVTFRISIQDTNGNNIDTYAKASEETNGAYYLYTIATTLSAGASVVFNSSDIKQEEVPGSFANGYYTKYTYTFDPIAEPNGCPNNPGTISQDFDFTAVSGILFTMLNAKASSASTTCYYQEALTDASVAIDYIKIGNVCPGLAGIKKANNVLRNLNIVPNPATSIATVNYETAASNVVVKVSDLAGAVVKTVNGSSTSASFNVADLAHGLYIVTVEVDGSPVSMKKLMVK